MLYSLKIILSPESEIYPYWKDMSIPVYLRIYLYNITNPMEIENGIIPKLEQVGPYTFREERHKINIKWNNNGTVSYQQIKRWYFETSMSNGSLSDSVFTLNAPMIILVSILQQNMPEIVLKILTKLLETLNSNLIISRSVDELLFMGYADDLLQLLKHLNLYPEREFGWFYKKNNSDDGIFTIYTGSTNINYRGMLDKWNGVMPEDNLKPSQDDVISVSGK
ncbi:scavenger receptor class B member 1-like [Centruroides sculpturatus]|uniref:scavenger receptor class B member 1-like n=1 Tax=Centruroides sculpturatus TaxID=218467 RepID=UPI000C6E9EA1|nr:scavenger receptor class B member 1-like [Centruroides sculpturatus]